MSVDLVFRVPRLWQLCALARVVPHLCWCVLGHRVRRHDHEPLLHFGEFPTSFPRISLFSGGKAALQFSFASQLYGSREFVLLAEFGMPASEIEM
jgi:hypothetical protein